MASKEEEMKLKKEVSWKDGRKEVKIYAVAVTIEAVNQLMLFEGRNGNDKWLVVREDGKWTTVRALAGVKYCLDWMVGGLEERLIRKLSFLDPKELMIKIEDEKEVQK